MDRSCNPGQNAGKGLIRHFQSHDVYDRYSVEKRGSVYGDRSHRPAKILRLYFRFSLHQDESHLHLVVNSPRTATTWSARACLKKFSFPSVPTPMNAPKRRSMFSVNSTPRKSSSCIFSRLFPRSSGEKIGKSSPTRKARMLLISSKSSMILLQASIFPTRTWSSTERLMLSLSRWLSVKRRI